jgi:hypothetical protein
VVGRDPEDLAVVAAEIERRYGSDYDVAAWPDPDAALEDLHHLRASDRPVALVLACQHADDDGVAFLGRVRTVDPQSQRAAIVRWGDFATSGVLLAALFAAGDVRRGSIKRVASAVGEGAVVISQVHAYLDGVQQAGR